MHKLWPPSVDRDRFDYINADRKFLETANLLNIVKLRYGRLRRVFLEVGQIISGYQLEVTDGVGDRSGKRQRHG